MKQPFFKELYVRSSLVNNNILEEAEEQKTEIIKVNSGNSEDATYRVWFKALRKLECE